MSLSAVCPQKLSWDLGLKSHPKTGEVRNKTHDHKITRQVTVLYHCITETSSHFFRLSLNYSDTKIGMSLNLKNAFIPCKEFIKQLLV